MREEKEKATVMTVRCGCLLGDGGNKMEEDRKQREVNFSSWILIMHIRPVLVF